MKTGLKVLVVDDEKMIRDAVSAYFSKMGCSIIEAEDGREALSLYRSEEIDFIILDLMLPEISGEEVCRQIRRESDIPIIMLTARTMEEDVLNGLGLGADDYVTKPFSIKELYTRMTVIMRRVNKEVQKADRICFEGGLCVDPVHSEVRKNDSLISLTRSEWRILSSMVKYQRKVFTRDELMEIAFGDESESFDRVIDTHIKNLRKKIEDDPKSPIYIKTVHGFGYKFGGETINEENSP